MSVLVLDSELQVEQLNSYSTGSPANASSPSRSSQRNVEGPSMLWGFDEIEPRNRFEQIQRRLIRLEAALFDDFGTTINTWSRDCLNCLFLGDPIVRSPSISSRPDGVLVATWRKEDGEELAVRCVSRSAIHFAVAHSSTSGDRKLNRTWGNYDNPSLFFKANQLARSIAL